MNKHKSRESIVQKKVNPMTKIIEWIRKFEKKALWKRKIKNRKKGQKYIQLTCKETEINSKKISSIECYKCDTFY